MKNRKNLLIIAVLSVTMFLTSCATLTKSDVYPKVYEEKPLAVLVMPPINQSTNVDAKDYFYSTLSKPICNEGYYVFPPFLSMYTLQRESAYDSELFINRDISKFGKKYGADVLMFTIIKSWNKSGLKADVEVEIEYIFKSTKTNEIVFDKNAVIIVNTAVDTGLNGGLGILANILATSIKTAATDYVKVARTCNYYALETEASMPVGPYHPDYAADGTKQSHSKSIRISVDSIK